MATSKQGQKVQAAAVNNKPNTANTSRNGELQVIDGKLAPDHVDTNRGVFQ